MTQNAKDQEHRMTDSTTPQDDAAMSPASTGSLAWIPVSERLPPDAEWVIVSRAGGTLSVEAMHQTGGRFMRGNSPVHPTHWMPLPEPPK